MSQLLLYFYVTEQKLPDCRKWRIGMKENRHLISEAAKLVGIETHVLRYWEEELSLTIHRNEMGHRYYTDQDIQVLKNVHKLKEQGFQLKAIKLIIPEMYNSRTFDLNHMLKRKDEINAQAENTQVAAGVSKNMLSNEHKLAQFQEIMNRAVSKALVDQQQAIGEAVGSKMSDEVSEKVSNKVLKQMDYLMRESDEQAEKRYQKLDETIREVQKARMEAAATKSTGKRKGLFHKKEKKKTVK